MTTTVRGRPADLAAYTYDTLPRVRGADTAVGDYASTIAAYRRAPSDLPRFVTGHAPAIVAVLAELEDLDLVPNAFARALQALDGSGARRTATITIEDVDGFRAAVVAALGDGLASPAGLRRAAADAASPASVAGPTTADYVVTLSTLDTLAEASAQLVRGGRYATSSIELAEIESTFDAVRGRGAWTRAGRTVSLVDALDDSADAYEAARVTAGRGQIVDDALRGLGRGGSVLAGAGTVLGAGGILLGGAEGLRDFQQGRTVEGSVTIAGAGASTILLLGIGGPVTLTLAAGVAVGSVVYEYRGAIGSAARATGEAISDAAGAASRTAARAVDRAGSAMATAGGVVVDTVEDVWPW